MLNVGVIGLGVGEQHIYGFNRSPNAQIKCICDLDTDKLKEVSIRTKVSNITKDPNDILLDPKIDVVSIASFDECHSEQVIIALNSGKHIFVEKPICLTAAELDAISKAHARAIKQFPKLKVSSNFILRQEARFIELKRRIDSGELGEVYSMEGSYDYGRLKKLISGWRAKTPDYSVMHGGGIHILDLFQWLTGQVYIPCAALAHKSTTKRTNFQPPDLITSLGYFGDKIVGRVGANFGSQTGHFHQIKVYGTKGTFVHDCGKTYYFFGSEPGEIRIKDNLPFPSSAKGDMIPSFISAIVNGTNLEIDFSYIKQIMRTSISVDTLANNR